MSRLSLSRLLKLSAAVAAGLVLQPAAAQTVSATGAGSAAVIPFYTVNDGWRTLIHITNTTGDSLAVKVRFHESRNSRDVLDFNIGLSPRDVWTGFLAQETVDGQATMVLRTADVSCVSPLALHPTLGAGTLPASIVGYSDFGPNTNETFRDHDATNGSRTRALEGYVVIMTMGQTPGGGDNTTATVVQNASNFLPYVTPTVADGVVTVGSSASKAKHINGVPRDCTGWDLDNRATASGLNPLTVEQVRGDTAIDIPGVEGSGDPCTLAGTADGTCTLGADTGYLPLDPLLHANALKVQATLRKGESGYAASTGVLHIEDWGTGGVPLVTAQQFPYFFEPTLASTDGLWTTVGLANVETGISTAEVFNDWVNNPSGDPAARSEWVLTFPTKHFHADEDYDNVQAACNRYRNVTTAAGSGGLDTGEEGLQNTEPGDSPFATFSTAVHSLLPFPVVPFGSGLDDDTATCLLDPFFETFQAGNNGRSFIDYDLTVYDREERSAIVQTGGTVQSPNPPSSTTQASLLYEANILRISRDPANVASVLSSPLTALGSANGLAGGANFGWARVQFDAALPVTGFMMRVRQFAGSEANQNDADAVQHGFIQ